MGEGDPTPLGYVRTPSGGPADLTFDGGRPLLAGEAVDLPLTAADVVRLRPFDGVRVQWPEGREGALETVLGLASAGVPVHAADVPAWAERADPGLTSLLTSWTPAEPPRRSPGGSGSPRVAGAEPVRSVRDLRREEHSLRLRRHAFANPAGQGATPAGQGVASGRTVPKVSVVMSSKRPGLLGSALAQIARQRHVEAEVLLGLHGFPASHEDVRRAVADFPLPLTVIEAGEDVPFGEVLNRAAAKASGDEIAKWDDDDWYSPEHLSDLLLARAYSGADIVGTAAEFFYLEPLDVTIRRTDYTSEIWSDHVAGGTIFLARAKFQEIGGFEGVARGVDAQFLKTAHAAGARIYRTQGLGYVLRRSLAAAHTWQLPLAHFLRVAANQWRGFRPSRILEAS
ncbi:glycosyltransferase family 2 protein [Sphaerisporangium corydalis]|uniref:Glycosyltransferase family 2 protein n=1 Tax=Sphaerisporangium corydalis TaxID=1441875 RepID=A0ABV9EKM1_9ACTN|nr:glycosyltransferase family 2 protein [Sphaerisporangium corydalis]